MKSRLLIVDDEWSILKMMKKTLERDGHICHTAESVAEAKVLMDSHSFDLIVTDLQMSGETGLDLLAYSSENYPDVGCIMMTGHNSMSVAQEAIQLGIYGYLIKPMDREMVRITIQNALRHLSLERQMNRCLQEAQKEVIEKNLMLEAIFDSIDVGVLVLDREMRILRLNKTMELMFPGMKGQYHKKCFDLAGGCSKREQCEDCPMKRAFKEGKRQQVERIIRTEDGAREFEISAMPIWENDDQLGMGLAIYQDVTELIEHQRVIADSNKLVAVGQLASGIAHEINTPIQFLGDNLRYLEESFEDLQVICSLEKELIDAEESSLQPKIVKLKEEAERVDLDFLLEELPQALTQSLDGVDRIANIVKAMKDFSHPGDQEKAPFSINDLIKNTIIVCKNEWKYVAEITLDLDNDLPLVGCFPNEINQVILILIVNAAHSIEEKKAAGDGKIGEIHITSRRQDAEHVLFAVRDTGKGIPPEIQEKIFQAFFTTKKQGKGTGQGLNLASKIVTEKHGGEITLVSQPGRGAEFTVVLPIDSSD